uniref:Uncharacterized protein LOC104239988 n=1 Tax=Nicotiana sylvestris TaxID=4096 RepID=A0A1U7XLZ8_NICSY|nr:PREDICTED: uncharacterized protein LOC104239988 [Nicotiana sylvestris]
MLARKIVATCALSKKLNAHLKASQVQDSQNSDDSFKSASEGERTGPSDSEQLKFGKSFVLVGFVVDVETPESRRRGGKKRRKKESESVRSDERRKGKEVADSSPTSEMVKMAICGAELEKVVESIKKIGGSGSGEAAKGLANLIKVGESYNPKKKRTPKTPGTTRANKKRKAASSETIEAPQPKGRATRSKLKQSDEELQKAMQASKKKRMDKGKAKVAEPVEAVYEDEMDPVHKGEHITVEVEVQTPKPKKAKTSLKKSSSVSKCAEPSTLAKWTRSAVKAKQVKITEKEDWSSEEVDESDTKQDKLAKFGKHTILKGRLLRDLEEE